MESNNLDQLGEAGKRRGYSHTARRITFSHKRNWGVNFAVLFSMDLYRQYTREVAWRFYHMRTVLESKHCINQEVLVYYLAACDIYEYVQKMALSAKGNKVYSTLKKICSIALLHI